MLQSIASASRRTGVEFGYLLNQARMESGFNPSAKAPTSSAAGLYQFTRQTWLATLDAHGAEHGLGWAADAIQKSPGGLLTVPDAGMSQAILALRNDPDVAAAMAAELASGNGNYLSDALGREANATDLSLAHFLGAEGAAKFLTAMTASPEASAAPLFPEAAEANRAVFFESDGSPRSLAQIHGRFAANANARVDGTPPSEQRPPSAIVRQSFRSEARPSGWTEDLRPIEAMPGHLSIEFARAAYRRLSSLGGR